MPDIFHIVLRSLRYNRMPVLYQFLIIVLLSAVITGSLLTGGSVKESLKRSSSLRLGNTGFLISSGTRYFDRDLVLKMNHRPDLVCTGLLELKGFCQSLNSQKGAFNTHIYSINDDFFAFQGKDISIKRGEIAVNRGLADYLGIKSGDDLIIRYPEISDVPADAPFAPGKDDGRSVVMKVGSVLEAESGGNFSLSISQITPLNIFMNHEDLDDNQRTTLKINRLLVKQDKNITLKSVSDTLKESLTPSDIGLRFRLVNQTGQIELVSDRIFIDGPIAEEVEHLFKSSAPVLTYLGNRFKAGTRNTPYSFVSALPSSLYPEIRSEKEIIINEWMARDLSVFAGDTIQMYWYSPDSLNRLIEKHSDFYIKKIVALKGIWADSLLMPSFPGISGKESCSDWDAGVTIRMNEIRLKDEDYWNKYRGTPKAFISYESGLELWGNNFGPATAIRFPAGVTENEIELKLAGAIDPEKSGFSITDLSGESVKAANESVDFGILFISLGFFIILSSLILLSFATSIYFDSKRGSIITEFALGFKNSLISKILLIEVGIIALAGSLTGAIAGKIVDIILTKALNTVWNDAVQTDTIGSYFSIFPMITGFVLTFSTIAIFMLIIVRRFINRLNKKDKAGFVAPSARKNIILSIISAVLTISLVVFSIIENESQLYFAFCSGTLLLVTQIFLWRQYYLNRYNKSGSLIRFRKQLAHLYYSFYPSNAVTPILFIAAGIFTVFITGANRISSDEKQMKRSGGTGGFLLWCETTIPLAEDLNTGTGRRMMGIDEAQFSEMNFVQMKKSSGNDASCLNLNHISAPPLIGIDPSYFMAKSSFSFSKVLKSDMTNPWQYLKIAPEKNTVYGIADQTVLDWGLKLKTGDTLVMRAESGQVVNIIIAAGLQSSIFQGNVLIGYENFTKFFPTVSGTSIMLVDGDILKSDIYKNILSQRLENYGVIIERTTQRLASFNKVTNTYLSVFGFFGALGMITGIAGLGFILLRNYNQRKTEFALMLATGFHVKKIRRMIISEQVIMMFAGVLAGMSSALVATFPSLKNSQELPWSFMILMIITIILTGLSALLISVRAVTGDSLITSLKKE